MDSADRQVRRCVACGCTDDRACVSPTAGPCSWADVNVCSACVAGAPDDYVHPDVDS